jgi:DnaJ family protein B protein 13
MPLEKKKNSPQFTKIISGEGMPVSKSGSSAAADAASSVRGNLHIHFNLSFPTYFSESQKGLLRKAFTIPNSSNEQAQGQANQPHHQQKKANVAAN